jgi:DNA repair protein RecN (Recombination protein N)
MLKELSIRNFAIIDDLRISFSAGLSILSGETGAGKSIILNAVNLLLGSRASADLIRTGAETAELEALFGINPESAVARLMEAQGFDASEGLTIRRIISRTDSNRVYINDRLATLQTLTAVTENLASISGQHAHQGLLKGDHHLLILDQYGGLLKQRDRVARTYREILPNLREMNALLEQRRQQSEQMELWGFQRQEIENAAVARGEDEALEVERNRLKNAELIFETVHWAVEALYGAPGSVVERLVETRKRLEQLGRIDPQLAARAESLADSAFHIEDCVTELRAYLNSVELDQGRLEKVEERLDALNRLKRKYGGSLEAVLEKLENVAANLDGIEHIDDKIEALNSKIDRLREQLGQAAKRLSADRRQAALKLSRHIAAELKTLKMPNTTFEVILQQTPAEPGNASQLATDGSLVDESGMDQAVFMIAPNIGEALKPLASIASGGELSRVVLAVKSILAESGSVETLVFDEVDAGIGGGTAEVVGRKLAGLARYHQIICITHLPQIARFADHHYRIAKRVVNGRTRTEIASLQRREQVKEIARMLGGEKITPATLAHAREMMED